jgi:hypothetical protein
MKKGVSTIISMVLLIVITITAAVILREWYLGNLQRNEMLVQQMTEQKIGQMTEELKATSYDPTGRYLYVQNTGTSNIRITDSLGNTLISNYHIGLCTAVAQWTWQYSTGAAWNPYGANGLLRPGETMRTQVASPHLCITDEYKITTANGYSYSFIYGIGSVLLSANPQSRIANYDAANGTSDNKIYLVATVYDSFGNPVPSSISQTVRFEVTSAKLVNPTSATTNSNGMATSEVTPNGVPGDVIARSYVTLPNGANVSGYANMAYTPALQIVSFVANWYDSSKTTIKVTMVVRNNCVGGSIGPVTATFSAVGPGATYLNTPILPGTQTIPAGTTRSFQATYTWKSSGVPSGTYTFYFLGNADTGTLPAGIHSPQSVSNTLTKVVT